MKWRVSWNKKIYDYNGVIDAYKSGEKDIIYQSKGRAIMRKLPQVNDIVYITCNKLEIMKCIVLTEFMIGNEQKMDIFNKGELRNHTDNDTYLKLKIVEVYDKPNDLKGVQRTWTKYPSP